MSPEPYLNASFPQIASALFSWMLVPLTTRIRSLKYGKSRRSASEYAEAALRSLGRQLPARA